MGSAELIAVLIDTDVATNTLAIFVDYHTSTADSMFIAVKRDQIEYRLALLVHTFC